MNTSPGMRLGYGTNSIGDVDPLEAVAALAELGYGSLAITLDHHTIDPFASDLAERIGRWRDALAAAGMRCAVETGARHLLDPRTKHEPTFVSPDRIGRVRRCDFTRRAIDVALALGADCVSTWSGIVHDTAGEEAVWDRLCSSLEPVLEQAAAAGLGLGFEPEPGMFVDSVARCAALRERMAGHPALALTLDTGHTECMGERPAADVLLPWPGRVVNVHVDDMLACRHEHLPLGTGDVDFAGLFAALSRAGYRGGLHVELPRQSHCWLETARQSAAFLRHFVPLEV